MTDLAITAAADLSGYDLLVLAMTAGPDGPAALIPQGLGLAPEQVQGLDADLAAVAATGKRDEVVRLPGSALGLPGLLLVGLSDEVATGEDPVELEALRRAAGVALRAVRSGRVAVALPAAEAGARLTAVATGALIGAYRYAEAVGRTAESVTEIALLGSEPAPESLDRARVIADSVLLAKRLVDTPPGQLPPAKLAEEAVGALAATPVVVQVLDEAELADAGYGGIVAVGQGSANPPRLVRLAYDPEGASRHLALVGKGITFDSGGLSLKPPDSMITMKCDMAGAAAVLAAVTAIAKLAVPVRVTAYLACAENMPSGTAQRPGDVITAYGGKTVEVLNTDAEGRLVMMDALVRAAEDSPDAVVDIATLTGAQMIALGHRVAGVMGNDDAWRDQVVAAAGTAGEPAWAMPIPDELRASLDSNLADIANIGEKMGGMMTAAAFLKDFVAPDLPWAHMDIAGPAFNDSAPWSYNAKGATGFGVRTLLALAESMAQQD